jgi:hypothetical protein
MSTEFQVTSADPERNRFPFSSCTPSLVLLGHKD